jgi:hypothetical protein
MVKDTKDVSSSSPNKGKRDEILRVALKPQRKRKLRIEAAKRGKSMSQTARDILFGDDKPVVE